VLDREAGNRLLASEKDRHEHELVTQAMKEVLRERSSELHVPSSPQLITTPTLWHLATPFEGKANSQENALTLACLLHPTPALSGFPHQARLLLNWSRSTANCLAALWVGVTAKVTANGW
jgi:isochorismate synthase